jgi:hypothetical protein
MPVGAFGSVFARRPAVWRFFIWSVLFGRSPASSPRKAGFERAQVLLMTGDRRVGADEQLPEMSLGEQITLDLQRQSLELRAIGAGQTS